MTGSRRPPPRADKCFVWIRDASGVLLHGLPVDGRGDDCEHAARAWLHLLGAQVRDAPLSESAVFYLLADGRRASVAMARLREWLARPGRSPREVSLKYELQRAQDARRSS